MTKNVSKKKSQFLIKFIIYKQKNKNKENKIKFSKFF